MPQIPTVRFDAIVRQEMPELDTIRGIAILLVVFYHGFYWLTGLSAFTGIAKAIVAATLPGWLGVNLFFVLSGFLITGILLDSKARQDYYRSFYTKRALRILPAYYCILLVLFVAGVKPRSFLVISFFFLSNVATLFGIAVGYSVLWSLAVEEHFYLIWPSLVRACSARTLENCALAIVWIVPALRGGSFLLGWTDGIRGYTWCEADGLVLGAWLAIYVRKSGLTRKKLARVSATSAGIALFGVLMGAPFGILTRQRLLGAALQESCANLAFLALLGFFLLLGTSQWKFLVQRPVLRFYGRISYGLYLVHLLVFDFYNKHFPATWLGLPPPGGHLDVMTLRFVICLGISTALAYLSRQYYEESFLQMGRRLAGAPKQVVSNPTSG